MPNKLCVCAVRGCCNARDKDPDTGQAVRGRYLESKIWKQHQRLDNQQINATKIDIDDHVFQAVVTARTEDDPVVHSRSHIAAPPPNQTPSLAAQESRPANFHGQGHPSAEEILQECSPAILALNQYEADFQALLANFEPPTSLDFATSSDGTHASVPKLNYNNRTKRFLDHQDRISRLITSLDGVDCCGNEPARKARKSLIVEIQSHQETLDKLIVQLWERQRYKHCLQHSSSPVISFDNGTS